MQFIFMWKYPFNIYLMIWQNIFISLKFYANLWPSYLDSNSDDTPIDEQSDELTENIKKSALVDPR